VLDPKKRDKPKVDENHGLWGFFNMDKKPLSTPEEDYAHGMYHDTLYKLPLLEKVES